MESYKYRHLAERVFDTPLLIEPSKLQTIAEFLLTRIKGETDSATVTAERQRQGLTVKDGIAVVDVFGTLVQRHSGLNALSGLTSYEELNTELQEAESRPDVDGILMVVDSPGGEASGAFDFADRVRAIKKPTWAIAEDMATSAAYLIGSSADRFYVTQSAITGSVGVVMAHVDQTGFNKQMGVKVTEIFAGKRKVDMSPHRSLNTEAKRNLQSLINRTYDVFVTHVARNRGLSEEAVRKTEAGLFVGEDATKVGFADGVLNLDAALVNMRARLDKPETIRGLLMEKREMVAAIKELDGEDRAAVLEAWGIEAPTEESVLQKVLNALNPPEGEAGITDQEVRTAIETLDAKIADLEARNKELENVVAEYKAENRRAKAIEKAEKLTGLGFTAEDAEYFEDMPDALYEKLVAFDAQKATAALFDEQGNSGDGETDSLNRIKVAADKIRDAHPELSQEEAEAKAVEDDPELYKAYLGENPKQVQ